MKKKISVLFTASCIILLLLSLQITTWAQGNTIATEDNAVETTPNDYFYKSSVLTPTSSEYSQNSEEGDIIPIVFDYMSMPVYYVVTHAPNNNYVEAWHTNDAFPANVCETYISEDKSYFPEIKLIAIPTPRYNCNSYAWYSQDYTSNKYWINDPRNYTIPFYSSEYELVDTPQAGDIICYCSSETTVPIIHSGIIISVTSSGTGNILENVVVQSKWAWSGLYEHRGDQCGYADAADAGVTFFRRKDHTHIFAKTTHNSDRHKKYCTDCGVTIWEEHNYSTVVSKNSTSHTMSCACGDSITQSHSFDYQDYNENLHKKYCACGYYTYVAHSYEYSYTDDQTHTKTCTLCDASYQDPHYEEIYSVEDNGDGTHDIICICEWVFDEAETHTYTEYDYYNDVYHKVSCICGDYELEAHELEYSSLDDTYHWEACEICGYENEVEHSYTASNTYYDLNHHKAFCDCGAYEITLHDEYTVKSYTTSLHTLQLTCCGTRTVTNWHTYEDYDSDSHTGDCVFCNHTLTTDQAHTDGNYMDNGNGTHTNKCNYCDYSHTEYHVYTCFALDEETHQRYCQKCDLDQVVEEHIFVDEYDENGWYFYCTGCQYKIYMDELTADMIAKLPVDIQTEMQSAPQNAQLNAQPDGDIYYVIRIDDENGILYLNGEYYLLRYPEIPDAETEPIVPSEESIS